MIPVGSTGNSVIKIAFSDDHSSLVWDFGFTDKNGHPWVFTPVRTSENNYSYSAWGGLTGTLTFTSLTTYVATHRGNYGDPNNGGCIFYADYEGHFFGS